MSRPKPTDFPEYFGRYIALVETDSLADAVKTYAASLNSFYAELPNAKADYAYAPGKWTLKEVLQHIIDAERVFAYRMLRIARKDKTPLASFDENAFAEHALASQRSFADLKTELSAVRRSTDLLIASLNDTQLSEQGIASNNPITANAVGYIIFGHLLHHRKGVEEHYL